METLSTEVLIVGAGPVGLAITIELAQRGIRCRVIDQTVELGFNPRAKFVNVRSMELMRRWGIAERVRQAAPLGSDYPANVIFATSLTGYPLACFTDAFYCGSGVNSLYSEAAQCIPQYTLMRVLRDHIETLPRAEVAFNCRFDRITQTRSGLQARVMDVVSGAPTIVECAYLVGADGGRSSVRKCVGIGMQGDHAYARNFSVIFRAPKLTQCHTLGEAVMYWLVNPACPAIMGPIDRSGLWFLTLPRIPNDLDLATLQPFDIIRRATGLNFEMELVATDSWVAHRLIADHYGSDRIFLAGDACHLHPPTGAYGMNMGISDAVDLGWKLAATLQGWGGSALLDAYEIERRPIHLRVIEEAVENYSLLTNHMVREKITEPGPEGDAVRASLGEQIMSTKGREFKTLGVVLGCRYQDSPIIVPDGSSAPIDDFEIYQPSARPGCLAPHHWLADGSSLYDHFGDGFTLIAPNDAVNGASDLAAAAAERGVPFHVFRHDDPAITELYQSAYALIRPDQFVAWRGNVLPQNAGSLLDSVCGAAPSNSFEADMRDQIRPRGMFDT